MYINELGIKEINAYYSRHGGRRTAQIQNFANYMDTAKAGRITAMRTGSAVTKAAENGINIAVSDKTETAKTQNTDRSGASADSNNSCCDTCRLTNQLMFRMLSGQLYAPNALNGIGYSTAGSGAIAAYQSLSKYLGANSFNLF